ncbi:DUF924 family protein [Dongshaea marina]|uniref:DUF924 family protein n=1 Tax=Dongshaea marina TaxID=2047966 RepID=UPI000D3E1479|nr:DUF924 family protein [Dongshaea marina]
MDYLAVLKFWFEECTPKQWFDKDPAFDALINERFGHIHRAAAAGELSRWRGHAKGRLAEVIVLDQFSRNIYRDKPQAFAYDGMALILAQEALRRGIAVELERVERQFLYMPFMHSESAAIHEHALLIFDEVGMESTLEYEKRHKAIIDRFGRYPHRNAIVGRESTAEELAFLQEPGSSF